MPQATPLALTAEFSAIRSVQWNAFIRKSNLPQLEMSTVIDAIRQFALAPLAHAFRSQSMSKNWAYRQGWMEL